MTGRIFSQAGGVDFRGMGGCFGPIIRELTGKSVFKFDVWRHELAPHVAIQIGLNLSDRRPCSCMK